MRKKTTPWAERWAHPLGVYWAVCGTKKQFDDVYKWLKATPMKPWGSAPGAVHTLENDVRKITACVVSIVVEQHTNAQSLMCTIIHEAVHVWQAHCEVIGERHPGVEQEAYTIERIACVIMDKVNPVWTRHEKYLNSLKRSKRGSRRSTRSPKAQHGEVAVYKYTVDGVKYTARIVRTDPNHTIL